MIINEFGVEGKKRERDLIVFNFKVIEKVNIKCYIEKVMGVNILMKDFKYNLLIINFL